MNGANLTGACLCSATLSWGGLELNGANLTNADFTGVDLSQAELAGATWSNTICPDGSYNKGTSPCTEAQISDPVDTGENYSCECGQPSL